MLRGLTIALALPFLLGAMDREEFEKRCVAHAGMEWSNETVLEKCRGRWAALHEAQWGSWYDVPLEEVGQCPPSFECEAYCPDDDVCRVRTRRLHR